jgi:hypothetical protein
MTLILASTMEWYWFELISYVLDVMFYIDL